MKNTLESVKRSLSDGDTVPAEKHGPRLMRHFPDEFRKLMAQHEPQPKTCSQCGQSTRHYFNLETGRWTMPNGCANCQRLAVLGKMNSFLPDILKQRGLHRRHLNASLPDLSKRLQDAAQEPRGLYLHGAVGTGKTYALAALMRAEAEAMPPTERPYESGDGYRGLQYSLPEIDEYPIFVSVPRFLLSIRSTFHRHGEMTEEDVIRRYAGAVGTLYLDDIGAEQATDWARQAIYLLLDERYAEERRTIISGNLDLDDLARRLDDRVASRIAGMCRVLKLDGRDRRLKAVA